MAVVSVVSAGDGTDEISGKYGHFLGRKLTCSGERSSLRISGSAGLTSGASHCVPTDGAIMLASDLVSIIVSPAAADMAITAA